MPGGFGLRLKQLREEKHMTQDDLYKATGISRNTIASWESGRRIPQLSSVEQLANFFGVPVDYLLGRTNERLSADDEPFDVKKLTPEERRLWKELELQFRAKKLTMGQIRAILAIMKMDEE